MLNLPTGHDASSPIAGAPAEPASAGSTPFRANWRDPSLYPPVGCEDRLHLAWEFLRRHPSYALHAEQMLSLPAGAFEGSLKKFKESSLAGQFCWPPADEGETVKDYLRRHRHAKSKPRIHLPRKTFRSRWSLKYPVRCTHEYDPKVVQFREFVVAPSPRVGFGGKIVALPLLPNEVAFRFRLDLNLRDQVEALRTALGKQMASFRAGLDGTEPDWLKSHERKHKKQDLRYAHFWLRCYDALALGEGMQRFPEDDSRRRAKTNGPNEQIELFKTEARAAHSSSIGSATTDASMFGRNCTRDFANAARERIEGMGYLLLLDHFAIKSKADDGLDAEASNTTKQFMRAMISSRDVGTLSNE